MSVKKSVILAVCVSLVLFFIVSAFVVSLKGKDFVESQAEARLKMKVEIGKIYLSAPFTINIQKIVLGDLFKAEHISFSPNIIGFFTGKIILDGVKVSGPAVNLVQSAEGRLNLPQLADTGKAPDIFITGLRIKRGRLVFTDEKTGTSPFKAKLSDINADISKVMMPLTSLNARFNFSANILSENDAQLGDIHGKGWVDFIHKGMDAVFECKNLEVVYFSPYYGSFLSNRKLTSAKADIKSQFKAEKNDLEILSNLKLYKLVYAAPGAAEGSPATAPDLTKSALDLFTDKEGNLNLDFKLRTKLDDPQLSAKEIKKAILNAAIKNLASQNPGDVAEKISGMLEQLKDFGKEMEGIFKKKK